MSTFNNRDYQLDTEYRNRSFSQKTHHDVEKDTDSNTNQGIQMSRRLVVMVIVGICIISGLVAIPSAQAQSIYNSDASHVADIEHALIMGTYYVGYERYEEAIEQFQIAIDGMPMAYFEIAPEQAIVFWQLGEALEGAGYLEDALVSYQQFIDLAGDNATQLSIDYVVDLQAQIDALNA